MVNMNILISSAGRRVSLLRSFKEESNRLGLNNYVFAIDNKPQLSAACNIADNYFYVESLDNPNYISNLLKICTNNNVKIIVPTIDTELQLYAQNIERFKEQGIEIVISDLSFVNKCRDKRLTHKLFMENGIDVPCSYDKSNYKIPLFVKPIDGSCSVGAYKVDKLDHISSDLFENKKLMILEYIDPEMNNEYTVDLYYDINSELKCIVPRLRIEVRSGEVSKAITRKNFLLDYLKQRLMILKGARGCITLQLFVNRTTNQVKGIEINPRFGGGYPLSYKANANFVRWILLEYLFHQQIPYFDDWEDNLLMLRYDDEILIHNAEI